LETPKNIASEYYSTDDMKKFKVPSMKKPKKKAKEDIIAFLEDSIKDDDDYQDHGNRNNPKKHEKADLGDEVTKKQKLSNYENALEKARE